jgi:hypothetical protein
MRCEVSASVLIHFVFGLLVLALFRGFQTAFSHVVFGVSIIQSNEIRAERGGVGVNHTHYEGASLEHR